MKLPRDLSGEEFSKLLIPLGYEVKYQTGSHMRLLRVGENEHRVTIPRHGDLKVGTLNGILKDIADNLNISKDKLMERLWGHG